MIPRLHKAGTSFTFAVEYITHDPEQSPSSERVAWTHTLNCAHDHVPSAVHEMVLTHRDAEFLKEQSGAGGGGGPVQKPVKHFSLSWHPDESPTREEMIEAAESYLKHMKWDEHQCVLAAHTDTDHPHLHGVLNAIHPETGLKLDDSFERRRSQEWALEYERSRGHIYCEQRLDPVEAREPAPPRNVHETLKSFESQHQQNEAARQEHEAARKGAEAVDPNDAEWKTLKAGHRAEREGFFAEGKEAYGEACKDVYRDVRELFRPQWAEYYAARRDGLDFETLAMAHAAIIDAQNAMLEERQKASCDALRLQRDNDYADLLMLQKDERATLRERQAEGLSSPELLETAAERAAAAWPALGAQEERALSERNGDDPWRSSADEITARDADREPGEQLGAPIVPEARGEEPSIGGGRSRPLGFLSGFIGFAGALLSMVDPVTIGKEERKPPADPPEFPPEQFKRFAEDARAEAERKAKAEYDRAWWEDRERRLER